MESIALPTTSLPTSSRPYIPKPTKSQSYGGQLVRHARDTSVEEPRFGEFQVLQRTNVLRLQNELAKLSTEVGVGDAEKYLDQEERNLGRLEQLLRSYGISRSTESL
jgi:hypothetical protein